MAELRQFSIANVQNARQARARNELAQFLQPIQKAQAQQGRAQQEAQFFMAALGPNFDPSAPNSGNQWRMAVEKLGAAGGDVSGISQIFEPNQFQAIQGLAGMGGGEQFAAQLTPIIRPDGTTGFVQAKKGGGYKEIEGIRPFQATAQEASDIRVSEEEKKIQAKLAAERMSAFEQVMGKESAEVYSKLQQAAQEASAFIPRLEALKEMASKASTGYYAEAKIIGSKIFGVDTSSDEVLNAQLMGLAQDILNQQTGTKTDYDFQVAVKQAASIGKSPKANVMLINALIKRQEEALLFGDMAQRAFESGGPKAVLDLRLSNRTASQPTPQGGDTPAERLKAAKQRAGM